jgi:hypothetical protein
MLFQLTVEIGDDNFEFSNSLSIVCLVAHKVEVSSTSMRRCLVAHKVVGEAFPKGAETSTSMRRCLVAHKREETSRSMRRNF